MMMLPVATRRMWIRLSLEEMTYLIFFRSRNEASATLSSASQDTMPLIQRKVENGTSLKGVLTPGSQVPSSYPAKCEIQSEK